MEKAKKLIYANKPISRIKELGVLLPTLSPKFSTNILTLLGWTVPALSALKLLASPPLLSPVVYSKTTPVLSDTGDMSTGKNLPKFAYIVCAMLLKLGLC